MQRALTIMILSSAHSGHVVLVAVLVGLLAAAALAASNTARAQDPPEPTTHQIAPGDSDAELTASLDAVFGSDGDTLAAVSAGDTIEFDVGKYEDIGRRNGFYLRLDKENLTVRGASDPRLGQAEGQCDPTTDTILTGSSGFELRAAGITVEQICFQDIDDGSLAHANPQHLSPILARPTANGATIRSNRIDNTIGQGVNGRINANGLTNLTITDNEFIDIGLIENNGAGAAIQPRHAAKEPSAIRLDTFATKSNLTVTDNLFDGSAWVAVSLDSVVGGTISGNTFRNMAKSAVILNFASNFTLDDNTYEGNGRAAWRVVRRANWLNDGTFGISGSGTLITGTKTATMESEALQTLMRLTKDQAEALGMGGDLYDAAVTAAANSVYRDPDLHAAVRVAGSENVTISNSTFTNNHNSIAICGEVLCRVDGLEAVGDDGDTGRSPAYIAPTTFPGGSYYVESTVTLSSNSFSDSDTRSFEGPGSIGNHLVIGYLRASAATNAVGEPAGSFSYGAGNTFTGSGVFGGAAAEHVSDISLESASAEVVEGANAVFNLTIDPPARTDLTVNYSVSEDGTWAGTLPDASSTLAGNQISVAAGVTSAVLTIPTVADDNVEADGSITVTIAAGDHYSDGATATVAVRDDTVSGISIASESTEVVEGANAVFNLTIDPPAGNDLTVNYSVSEDGSWVGTLPDDDSTLAGNQITVAAGAASAVLTIPTVSDGNIEADGSITVTIESGDRYSDGATATVAVSDGTLSGISIASASAAVVEGANAVFNLTIDPPALTDLTVNYSVSEVGSWVGTLPDASSTLAGNQITVAAGAASAVLTIPIVSDGAAEADGSITVTIEAGERYSDGATATVAVSDDTVSTISIASASAAVVEGANAVFNLTIDPAAGNDLTINYSVSEVGSWAGTLPDDDSTLAGNQITVAAGDASAVLTIPIASDGAAEADGSITVTIAAGERYSDGATATVAVSDDTVSTISIASASAEVVEGANAVFNLTIDPAAGNDLTVNYSVSEDGSWVGTLPDDDSTLPGNQITVAAGDASAVLTIPIASDGAVEDDGSITVTIEAGERYSDGATATVAVRDDTVSAISITSESAQVVEGAAAVFNLTIDPPAANDLTVNYSVSEVGSFAGTLPDASSTLPGNQITVAAGDASAVLTIPTVSDGTGGGDGSITVTIESGDRYSDGASATVDVRDTPAPVVVAPPPPPVFILPPRTERDDATVEDGAATVAAGDVTVDLSAGSLPEDVESIEVSATKLSRSRTPDAPDGGRFGIAGGAVYDIELEATLADETSEALTELAAPVTVCLPIPRNVDNPVVLRYDDETEEWVKLAPAPSSEEDQVCGLTDEFSIYAVADEADHTEGLSATEINDFSVWEADYPLNASDLLAVLLDVNLIWVWNDETWTGYATFEGEPIPGAIDFLIANGDTLWLGDGGSGGDG